MFSPIRTLFAASLLGPAKSTRADDVAKPEPKAAANTPESQADELSRRATDPTASPPNFSFIGDFTLSSRDLADGTSVNEKGYALRFQPVVPFKAWGVGNIFRGTSGSSSAPTAGSAPPRLWIGRPSETRKSGPGCSW